MTQILFLLLAIILGALATAGIPQPTRFHFLSAAVTAIAVAMLVSVLGWR